MSTAIIEWSPPWLVMFDCGHVRHPEQYGNLGDGPPPNGWGGWCLDCHDHRTTVDVIVAAPLENGSSFPDLQTSSASDKLFLKPTEGSTT